MKGEVLNMLRLYNSKPSGNCYKVRLLLAQLGRPYETIEVDVVGGGPRPDHLMQLNPLGGKVPVLELENGRALVESNAILWHLAQDTPFLPDDPDSRTEVLRWMFFEQNIHEPSIAVSRFLIAYLKQSERFSEVIKFNDRRGHLALRAMETHLEGHPYFVGERYSIADIALYAYTHCADEGGFDLTAYPRIGRWLERVRDQPGHVRLDA